MQLIIRNFVALLLFTAASSSHAEQTETFRFQVETRQVSASEGFWSSFWEAWSGRKQRASDLSVKVLNEEGRPLVGATVLVGQQKGNPFVGNQALTDSSGVVGFSDGSLHSGKRFTVTASLDGYSTVSVVNNVANRVEITLPQQPDERDFSFFRGKVTGFPPGYGNGTLELGIFSPAFRPESLLNFDPQQFISSYKVKIEAYGQRDVPGNLVFPTQQKRWGLIPLSISKPDFVMPLPKGLEAHMTAVVGAVSISAAMAAIQKKDFISVLNLASLTHVGWTSNRVQVNGDENFDVAAKEELVKGALTAQLSGVQEKLDAVAVSLVDPNGDRGDFIGMDVKALKSESISNGKGAIPLNNLKQRHPQDMIYVFAGIFDRNQLQNSPARSIVGSLQAVKPGQPSVAFNGFLSPIRSLGVSGENREFRFTSAANRHRGLVPSLMIVNIVSEKSNSATQGVTRKLLWSSVVRGPIDQLSLPNLGSPVLPPPDTAKGERFLWEVIAVRATGKKDSMNLQSELRNLQDVSSLSQRF